jgi:hypothetical protein
MWNLSMTALTAFTSSLSMLPYVYLNTRGGSSLSPLARWSFPALRASGGFLTTTMMQLIIQRRITSIVENKLSERRKRRNNDGSNGNQNQTRPRAAGGESQDPEKEPGDSGACNDIQCQQFSLTLLRPKAAHDGQAYMDPACATPSGRSRVGCWLRRML